VTGRSRSSCAAAAPRSDQEHWDAAYAGRGTTAVSWYQPTPTVSIRAIGRLELPGDAAVIDVGGGASSLVEGLIDAGWRDITVLDISQVALDELRARVGAQAPVTLVRANVLEWEPTRRFDVWHDRAVFHFLVEEGDRKRYVGTLRRALRPGGFVVIGTFAPDGPQRCSGLPVVRYGADELADVLGSAFEPVETEREVHITPSGVAQPFTWLTARLRTPD
jgi:SAM-dependent methyltransferase